MKKATVCYGIAREAVQLCVPCAVRRRAVATVDSGSCAVEVLARNYGARHNNGKST